jgi:outer membrane lipoprotein-sorting protein
MGSGYFMTTVSYDWNKNAMKIEYTTPNNYVEYYQFNAQRGYDPTVKTGQFTYQYLYKQAKDCPCDVSNLQVAMPAWFLDAPNQVPGATPTLGKYWPASFAGDTTLSVTSPSTKYSPANTNFQTTNTLTKQTKSYNLAQAFWIDPVKKQPAGFALIDQSNQIRTFTIKTITEMTSTALGLVEPTGSCPCDKLVDIALSLDRSGSISVDQWTLEYDFVKQIAASFTYGPLGAQLGIGNWNAQQWVNLPLSAGTSKTAVDTAVNAMTCCPGTSGTSCCCCNTPIGGGLYLGGTMLADGRAQATKVLIILTDGCQNHIWNGTKAISCGCTSELACSQNKNCTSDITKWYDWVKRQFPGTTIIAVGVGDSTSICPEQLNLAAGGDPNNVYNPTSWDQLASIVKTISSTACSLNNIPCTSCCGLCTCGKCIPAPNCKDQDKCNIGKYDSTLQCCRTDPVTCIPPPCYTATCDKLKGCVNTSVTCKNSTDPCTEWACNSTTIVCLRRPATNAPASCGGVIVNECVNNSDCNRGDSCTVYNCTTAGKCINNPLVCPKSDNCTTWYCKPGVGCVNSTKKCDDGNLCTDDSCNPAIGCVFAKKPLCPQPSNQCLQAVCDPIKGCINVPVNCTEKFGIVPSKINCTVPACNTTCYNKYICIAPTPIGSEPLPQTVILASALGTAAIVGIVIAAAVLLAGLGTAAGVAIVGAAGAGGVALVAQNPVYVPSGAAGNNVLYKNE